MQADVSTIASSGPPTSLGSGGNELVEPLCFPCPRWALTGCRSCAISGPIFGSKFGPQFWARLLDFLSQAQKRGPENGPDFGPAKNTGARVAEQGIRASEAMQCGASGQLFVAKDSVASGCVVRCDPHVTQNMTKRGIATTTEGCSHGVDCGRCVGGRRQSEQSVSTRRWRNLGHDLPPKSVSQN